MTIQTETAFRRSLNPQALDWVAATIGPGARVVRRRRLFGGVSSDVHAVDVVDRDGHRHRTVLKWFPRPGPEPADPWVRREVEVLTMVGAADVPSPEVLGMDPAGEHTEGVSALLMSRVPGRVHLTPRDPENWLRQTAVMLARIHALDVPMPDFDRWRDHMADKDVPCDATDPAIWHGAVHALRRGESPFVPTVIHRDYQHYNLLWTRDRLTGVVDWASGCLGPPDVDVGHCRLNLAVLMGAEAAERFREMYEAESGRTVDPWWDLFELMIYDDTWPRFIPVQVAGRADVDTAGMTGRVQELIALVLRRL